MAWTTPNSARATGYVVTAADWNADQANAAYLFAQIFNPPSCKATLLADGFVGTSTALPVAWTAEQFDDPTNPLHSTSVNNTRFTITVPGRYRFLTHIRWRSVVASTGERQALWKKNGVTSELGMDRIDGAYGGGDLGTTAEYIDLCTAGDYFEVVAFNGTGGGAALNWTLCWAFVQFIGNP